jgi:hypothetical protein
MNKQHRNHAADRRANSLKLNPRKQQTNSFRHFSFPVNKSSDIDLVINDRIARCEKFNHRIIKK